MDQQIKEMARSLREKTIARRRDFHKYAESGWTEFRTASIIADQLSQLGYKVFTGEDVVKTEEMMGVPAPELLDQHMQRAIEQGGKAEWIEKMRGGHTGVVGIMIFKKPGPVVAFRFDMDALDAIEAEDNEHRPYRENFSSVNRGAMHACGHDGHAAMGLSVAEVLAQLQDQLAGTVKIIFQPAEEGVRGAKAMVASGIADDVDYLVGCHLSTVATPHVGQFSCESRGFFATSKFDATFKGWPSHASAAPEEGRNAILAAACATLNLYAISRHSKGVSRVNVGRIEGGTGRNVIGANALLKVETRGATTEINDFMEKAAMRTIKAAADMHNVEVSFVKMGGAAGADNDPELVACIQKVAEESQLFKEIIPLNIASGSEDCTYFMERVNKHGGKAAYVKIGAERAAGHHDFRFDFNEEAMPLGVAYLSLLAAKLLAK